MLRYAYTFHLVGNTMAAVTKKRKAKAQRLAKGSRGKASGKPSKNARAKTKKKGSKKAAAKLSREQVMAQFEKSRNSDVSDKVFVATSPVHGKGLFAAKRIKANTVLGRLEGMPTFDDGIYVLWITDELGLELTNDFKFINHDKNPNAAYSDLDVTILKDVEAGDELLHDYGW